MIENTRPPQGTKDYLLETAAEKQELVNRVKSVFERFGYAPIETPAIENIIILEGGYRGNKTQSIFRIMARGEELQRRANDVLEPGREGANYNGLSDLGLRYDLTVPLSRILEQYKNIIRFPFKRYQIAPVWRTERPSAGRLREFAMCDADTIGSNSLMDDAESIMIVGSVFREISLKPIIRINNRKILEGIMEIAGIDEKNRISSLKALADKLHNPLINLNTAMLEIGIKQNYVNKAAAIMTELQNGNNITKIEKAKKLLSSSSLALEGVMEIEEVLKYLDNRTLSNVMVNILLLRGVDYYTGTIIDTKISTQPQIKSCFNGGRYTGVVGIFSKDRFNTTGVTLSLERLLDGLAAEGKVLSSKSSLEYMVAMDNQSLRKEGIRIGNILREQGFNTQVYPITTENLSKQLKHANFYKAKYVVIISEEMVALGKVKVKDMKTGEQTELAIDEFSQSLKLLSDLK